MNCLTDPKEADILSDSMIVNCYQNNLKDQIQGQIKEQVIFFRKENIDDCPWPETEEGQYVREFLTPLIKNGVSQYIENVKTDYGVLILDDLALPISINKTEWDNSYVCSPFSYFISYAKESLDFVSRPWVSHSGNALLDGCGKILKKLQFNKIIVVNNWLFSTNLYPKITPEQLLKIKQFLQNTFLDHAIVFRGVDESTNPVCYQTLQDIGFEYIATRQIFFLNPLESSVFESRLFKSDLKTLKTGGYEIIDGKEIKDDDLPRLLELYTHLYIDKYSTLNPKFNEKYLNLMLKKNLMTFKGLKKNGRIDGIIGYVEREKKMYCPYFGYDRNIPKEEAVYRQLCTVLMLEAEKKGLFFHQSAGASAFKKMRKAHDCIEYTAVFDKHLKFQRRIPWIILKMLYNTLGVYFMKRY